MLEIRCLKHSRQMLVMGDRRYRELCVGYMYINYDRKYW